MNKRYVVQYKLPYEHCVQVGIVAEDEDQAKKKASELFDAGDIWDDSSEVPLLFDDFIETGESGLEFTVEQTMAVGDPWPDSDACVKEIRRRVAAFRAALLLVEAYQRGEERGGVIDWNDLDLAYRTALKAIDDLVGS